MSSEDIVSQLREMNDNLYAQVRATRQQTVAIKKQTTALKGFMALYTTTKGIKGDDAIDGVINVCDKMKNRETDHDS